MYIIKHLLDISCANSVIINFMLLLVTFDKQDFFLFLGCAIQLRLLFYFDNEIHK